MATSKFMAAIFFSFLLYGAFGNSQSEMRLREEAQQCQLQRITARQPTRRIESEGGVTEIWEPNEDEFQCAGVAAIKNIVQTNSLSLPNFQSAPMLVYIEQGEGFVGMSYPGCAETYESQQSSGRWSGREGREGGQMGEDQHQRVHRVRRGDIIAIPAGAAHWCYNDGNEELIAVAFMDLKNQENQLDQRFRAFFLAGGQREQGMRRGEKGEESFQNIFRAFDPEILAEAYNIQMNIVKKMQEETSRGIIVRCDEKMKFLTPEEQEEEQGRRWETNGFEETICTSRIKHNMNIRGEADFYSRDAGSVHIVNMHKLPILKHLDISAEKGHLLPNALYTPHWSMTDNRVMYVIRGDAQVQISDNYGQKVSDERVKKGDMLVIPQFYATMAKAGSNGLEWVTFKTSGQPMKSPMVGYTSVMRAMPQQVLENAYQISPREAQNIKMNRRQQTFLLPPGRMSS